MLDQVVGTVFLLLLVYGALAVAAPLSDRWLAGQGALVRVLGLATGALVYLTGVFHVLLALGLFARGWAAGVLALTVVCVRLAGATHSEMRASIREDLGAIGRAILAGPFTPARAVDGVVAFFATVTVARALMLPTVGWDAITYHFVKAGIWVQSGAPIALQAPGGWAAQRGFFGGGEVVTAWAMLPFGNDLLAPGVDLVWWMLAALALFVLGRELGIRARQCWAAVAYVSFLPAVWDAVGWGYVDLANHALSLMGLVFAARFVRTRRAPLILLASLALGLAAGVKLTSVPLLLAVGSVLLIVVLRDPRDRGVRLGHLLAGAAGTLLLVGPWMIDNWLQTGHPLSLPLTVGGIALGPESAASTWFGQREFSAYTWASEWNALRGLFPLPHVDGSHLSALTLLPLALAPVGIVRGQRDRVSRRLVHVLLLCYVGVTLLFFYSPAFSVIRVEFVWTNGRFLVPVVAAGLLFAFVALPVAGPWRDWLAGYLLLATLVHFGFAAPLRLLAPSLPLVAGGTMAVLLVGGVLVAVSRTSIVPARLAWPGVALAVVMALFALREPALRYDLLGNRNVPADWFRYWWVGARLLDEAPGHHRIAATSGPWQDGDNWLMYYFMGRNLQSTLHYVPISSGGEIIPFGPDGRREREGDEAAWMARLEQAGITHVISFAPTSVELGWMAARPDRFTRLTGHADQWALFGVVSEPGRAPSGE